MALCWALLCLSYSASIDAQNVTGNLVYTTVNPPPSGAQYNWSGFVNNNTGGGGTSGGNMPAYNSVTGTFIFGYTQGTVAYNMAINQALANAGSGIQVSGFNYSWRYYNQDFSRGTLSGVIGLTDSAGKIIQSYNYTMPKTTEGWTLMSGTQLFPVEYAPAGLGNLTVSFSGKDDRYWAGYYGPQIREIDVRLRYSVDPCVTNPAYAPNCPGFNNVVTSGNLVPNPGAVATWGGGINNSYAINTAFSQAGTGLQIHGFEYGFYARAQDYCAVEIIFCFDNRKPFAQVNVNITDSANKSLHSNQYNISNQEGNFSNRYLFSQSQQLSNLGNFYMTAGTSDNAVVSNTYSRAIYTPDLCMRNPSSSPACPGYFTAVSGTSATTASTSEPTSTIAPTSIAPTTVSTSNISMSTPITVVESPVSTTSTISTSGPVTTTTATAATSATPNATNPQPRIGEVAVSGSPAQTTSSQSVSVSQVLNIIRSEQSRVSRLEMSTATAAVEQAKQESEKTVAEATAVAATQQAQSAASSESSSALALSGGSQPLGGGLQVSMNNVLQFSNIGRDSAFNASAMGSQSSAAMGSGPSAAYIISPVAITTSAVSPGPAMSFAQRQQIEEAVNQQNTESASTAAALNPTNPLNSFVNPPSTSTDNVQQNIGPAVNRNVQPNTAASGSDITVIATAPPGFDAYQNGRLPDGAFYAPREIYRNQRPVDNARAQRALSGGSDRLHQEMINQQYQGLGR